METELKPCLCINASCIQPKFDSAVVKIMKSECDSQGTVIAHSDIVVLTDPSFQEVVARDTIEGMMQDLNGDVPDMSQMDDTELMRTTMSRHCQSPAAVKAYGEYIDRRVGRYNREVQDQVGDYVAKNIPVDKDDKGDKGDKGDKD